VIQWISFPGKAFSRACHVNDNGRWRRAMTVLDSFKLYGWLIRRTSVALRSTT